MWIRSLEEEDTRDYEIKHTGFAGLFVYSAINFQSFVLYYDDIAGMSVLYPMEKIYPSLFWFVLSTNFSFYTALFCFLSRTWNFGCFTHFNLKVL